MPTSVAAVVRLAMSAIALLIFGMFAASGWGAMEVKRNVAVAAASAADVAGPQLDLENAIKDVQINVIQVQQWLTDISATRGLDGLDDGYAVAAEQAEAFARNAALARDLSRDLGLADLDAALSQVETAFPDYYAAGRAMAAQYIAGGAEAGNVMMAAFDATAERLGEELEKVLEMNAAAVEDRRGGLDHDLAAARHAVDASNRVVLILGAVALLAIAGFAVVLFRSVVHPFRDATEAARRLAGGDATGEIVVRGRLSEPRALAAGLRTFRDAAEVQLAATRALENSMTAMVVTQADGRPILANRAFAGLWARLDQEAHRRWSTGSGAVGELDFSRLVAAVQDGEAKGAVRAKPGGRRAVELRSGDAIVEVRMAALSGGSGAAGAVIEIEHVSKIRRLEDDFLRVIEHVQAGDFDLRVEEVDDLGFTSTAARGFNTLCESVARFMTELSRAVDGLANGDLTVRVPDSFSGRFAEACEAFNRSVAQLRGTVQEVASAAGELNAVAGPIATGARDLASRTESQAAALEQMSATMTELGTALKDNADLAGRAVGLARDAAAGAETGTATVAETVEAVTRIERSSNRIRDIVNVIDGIAFQTNLLALNAAVEAARAGDSGKGFAVVASEVRQLAQRSADAAEEVRKLIEESSAHVADGVRLVKRTGETLGHLDVAVRSVTSTVTDIAQSVAGQADGLGQIVEATRELDDATQRNAALADESSSAAGRLTQRAERLGELVSAFKLAEGAQASNTRSAPRYAAE